MSPEQIKLVHALHDYEMLRGSMIRLLTDIDSMLETAQLAHRKDRREVVTQRLDASRDDIRAKLTELYKDK